MAKWEYATVLVAPPRLVSRDDDRDERLVIMINGLVQDYKKNPKSPSIVLNEMGEEGWELVSVLPVIPASPSSVRPGGVWEYVLKRGV